MIVSNTLKAIRKYLSDILVRSFMPSNVPIMAAEPKTTKILLELNRLYMASRSPKLDSNCPETTDSILPEFVVGWKFFLSF
jgi:hypothetical protein